MARPKSHNPKKTAQVLFRLTDDQSDLLEAVAYLHRTTPNEMARRQLVASLEPWRGDPEVESARASRAAFDCRRPAEISPLQTTRGTLETEPRPDEASP